MRNNWAMNITLTQEDEALVQRLIKSGRCGSESEAVSKALKLLEEDERLFDEIRAKVQEGIAQADRGELIDAQEVFARLKREHEAQFGPQDWRA